MLNILFSVGYKLRWRQCNARDIRFLVLKYLNSHHFLVKKSFFFHLGKNTKREMSINRKFFNKTFFYRSQKMLLREKGALFEFAHGENCFFSFYVKIQHRLRAKRDSAFENSSLTFDSAKL